MPRCRQGDNHGMFKRLRAFFDGKPQVGDLVTVLAGPYAGKTGAITAVEGQDSIVFIDECCQPRLTDKSIRLVRRGGGSSDFGPPDAGTDVEYETARTRIRQIPPVR